MRTPIVLALISLAACGGSDVDREVGARCESVDDCDDRCLNPSPAYPDGFCTLDCGDNGDCPSDTDCVDREGGVCLFICFDNGDCNFLGPGWTCHEERLREDPGVRTSICRG
jgi:hypothetical protein